MRLALVSMNQAWENKAENFQACRALAGKAKAHGAELIIFPEMTLTAFSMNVRSTAEDRNSSVTVNLFNGLAKELSMPILYGAVFRDGHKATNNAIFIDEAGNLRTCYIKIHPFSFAGEDKLFNGGKELGIARFGKVTAGITICYDLRFPELYSALGKQCELIVNIANWPNRRLDHWNTLLKARAIENQVFIVGVNRSGKDNNGLEYVRSSQVIRPDGELLSPVFSEDVLDIFDVDLDFMAEYKKSFSTTQDRKPDLYKYF